MRIKELARAAPNPNPKQVRVEQLPHLGAQQLRLEVYDQDQIGSDDLIGVTTLELPDLQALHISPHLPISRYISLYLATSPARLPRSWRCARATFSPRRRRSAPARSPPPQPAPSHHPKPSPCRERL